MLHNANSPTREGEAVAVLFAGERSTAYSEFQLCAQGLARRLGISEPVAGVILFHLRGGRE